MQDPNETTSLEDETRRLNSAVIVRGGQDTAILAPQDSQEYWQLAQIFHRANSNSSCKNPFQYMVVMAYGAELGFSAVQSVALCAMINGKPSVYGKGLMSKVTEAGWHIKETFEGEPFNDEYTCHATLFDAEGKEVATDEYSVFDAKRAGLWVTQEMSEIQGDTGWKNRQKAWWKSPKRMMKWRARGYLIGDHLSHLLHGASIAEAMDPDPLEHQRAMPSSAGTVAGKIESMAAAKIDDDVEDADFVDINEVLEQENPAEKVKPKPEPEPEPEKKPEPENKPAKKAEKKPAAKTEKPAKKVEKPKAKAKPKEKKPAKDKPAPIQEEFKPQNPTAHVMFMAAIDKAQIQKVPPVRIVDGLTQIEPLFDTIHMLYTGEAATYEVCQKIVPLTNKSEWFQKLEPFRAKFTIEFIERLSDWRIGEMAAADAVSRQNDGNQGDNVIEKLGIEIEIAPPQLPDDRITPEMKDWLEFLEDSAVSPSNVMGQFETKIEQVWFSELDDEQQAFINARNKFACKELGDG